jgi:hypothetical protein
MSQHDTCDGNAEYAGVGEVGQAKPAGFVKKLGGHRAAHVQPQAKMTH